MTNRVLKEYLDEGYSIIPIVPNSKVPLFNWGQYQRDRASPDLVKNWFADENRNVGIVCGKVSSLAAIDIDDMNQLGSLTEQFPELLETTTVRTRRGCHKYFKTDKLILSQNNFLGFEGVELKGERSLVVAPNSIVKDHLYSFETPLSEILPYPLRLIEEQTAQRLHPQTLPYHRTHGMNCIYQIEERELIPPTDSMLGERDLALFVLFNQLRKARHSVEFSKWIVTEKNSMLRIPLSPKRLEKVLKKDYHLDCSFITRNLSFISCEDCSKSLRRGQKMKDELISPGFMTPQNIRNASPPAHKIMVAIIQNEKEYLKKFPAISELAIYARMDRKTVRKALEELRALRLLDR